MHALSYLSVTFLVTSVVSDTGGFDRVLSGRFTSASKSSTKFTTVECTTVASALPSPGCRLADRGSVAGDRALTLSSRYLGSRLVALTCGQDVSDSLLDDRAGLVGGFVLRSDWPQDVGPGCEDAGPGCEDVGPGCEEVGPGCEDAGPGCEDVGP